MENYSASNPTVTNCTFTGNSAESGGGMHNWTNSSPTVTDCSFSGNSADMWGGGMCNYPYSSPTVTNCTFSGNSATSYSGGGMYNRDNSSPLVTNCDFIGNSADQLGGGIRNDDSNPMVANCSFRVNVAGTYGGGVGNTESSPTVTNCIFIGNLATGYYGGGGIYNALSSSPAVTNCVLTGNSADTDGGGISNISSSDPTLTNCTFSGNTAGDYGGGMYNWLGGNPTLRNCILWGNTAGTDGNEIALESSSSIDVNYCDIEGGQAAIYNDGTATITWGSNIDADPNFFDPDNPDPNLRDYHLRPGSPCIDAGDNSSVPADTADLDGDGNTVEPIPFDIDGDVRFDDGDSNGSAIVDMGSDEVIWDGAENIAPEDPPVTLNPGGGPNDPNIEALVVFDNNSLTDANITVVETSSNPNPPTGGFEAFGKTLRIDTSLADGEFFMTVVIPFDVNDLDGADPCTVDLMYYDDSDGNWVPAVTANTGSVGTRWVEVAPGDPAPTLVTLSSRPLGDYGVYWNTGTKRGYTWANVDHSTDFGAVVWLRGDTEPDGDVDLMDFAVFAARWPDTGCGICSRADLTCDGEVGLDDLKVFTDNWLAGK